VRCRRSPRLGLFPHEELAADAGLRYSYRGATYAVNLPTEEEVDNALACPTARARVVRDPQRASWGGYSGYVADPDGHLWELCCKPGFPLDEHGRIDIQ
jgi:uncharacterized protein